ncbi:molybdopterin synthase sulfur carrier subunit [Sodalis ligni]|jgi:molybdopterin synthase sulfur carrier subunit|uniref:Molybdopterin synthase sulfur carrier subunit n=1 Tax=Sodalis ligni TaxID=2697027 RepID=A0A4R1NB46_9GAMM|nr:molybdopterin synthase sulfur carrier subunit [Sodalis ligni]QWA12632.1 molybdopterin synthase sulfur carrier subunit [Sodalis ligni]TCL03919.1 molybdopterin synthase subunit MoaD [Sodalis ligni]
MITVLFFARIRESVGVDRLTLDSAYGTVEALRLALCERGERWSVALEPGKVLSAVNQTLVSRDHPVAAGDEVAFFPPVTGG